MHISCRGIYKIFIFKSTTIIKGLGWIPTVENNRRCRVGLQGQKTGFGVRVEEFNIHSVDTSHLPPGTCWKIRSAFVMLIIIIIEKKHCIRRNLFRSKTLSLVGLSTLEQVKNGNTMYLRRSNHKPRIQSGTEVGNHFLVFKRNSCSFIQEAKLYC